MFGVRDRVVVKGNVFMGRGRFCGECTVYCVIFTVCVAQLWEKGGSSAWVVKGLVWWCHLDRMGWKASFKFSEVNFWKFSFVSFFFSIF